MSNRLQFALLREAVALTSRYGVDPGTIDRIMEGAFGRRWSIVGPFRSMALGGVGTFTRVASLVLPSLAIDVQPEEFAAVELPDAAELGDIATRRDEALATWLRLDREAAQIGTTRDEFVPAGRARIQSLP